MVDSRNLVDKPRPLLWVWEAMIGEGWVGLPDGKRPAAEEDAEEATEIRGYPA